MPVESGALGALVAKFGWLKLLTLGAALLGALLMAVFRPPKSRKEMFLQGAVALGASLLFGDTVVQYADYMLDFIDLKVAPYVDYIQFTVATHGLVGALSWGIFGGIAHYRDKVAEGTSNVVDSLKSGNK